MPKPFAIAAQAVLYALFAATIGWFSFNPRYQHLEPEQALLKLSFSHPGQLREECRKRTAEELANLPPNMRQALDCPRERSLVTVELALDGEVVTREVVRPAGVSRDGPSTLYARYVVPAGEHHLAVRINDSVREPGFRHVREEQVQLAPGRILVVDFDPGKGGILFQ
jgi:hypothetical protein